MRKKPLLIDVEDQLGIMRSDSGLLPYNVDIRKKVLKEYNTDERRFAQDVEIIRNWLKLQKHLPEITCDEAIEKFLLFNKLSIEKCKSAIDMYYTIRTIVPQFYVDKNPKLQHVQNALKIYHWLPLSKLTEDNYRILFFKLLDADSEKFDQHIFYANIFNLMQEILLHEDFSIGYILLCDFEGINLGHVKGVTPTLLANIFLVLKRVISNRVKGVYMMNCAVVVEKFVNLIKQLITPKLANRIYLFKNTEDCFEKFDVNLFPSDYGGQQPSLKSLQELVNKKYMEYQDRFDLLDTLRVNESLRPEKLKNDELLGFYGNFKKLDVD